MTIELHFEDAKQLKLFNDIINKGIQTSAENVYRKFNSIISNEKIVENIKPLFSMGEIMKSIREAIKKEDEKEKYLKEYNMYLKLKEKFEGEKNDSRVEL